MSSKGNRGNYLKQKMRIILFMVWVLVLNLCACSPSGTTEAELTWQDYYDLGVRYLSEGNYEEAIIAFTAAIEIDPKRTDAYVGLSDAYLGLGDMEAAEAALRQGYDATGDEALLEAAERLANDRSSEIDTTQDEVQLDNELLTEGVVSYSDLPEILFIPFNQLDNYLPVVNRMSDGRYMEFDWKNKAGASYMVHSCQYDSNTRDDRFVDVSAVAPLNGTEILRIDINSEIVPIGLRDIQMGDSFATIVEKLGLNPALAEYAEININLFAENEGYGHARRESKSISNGVPSPCISVHFGTAWEDYEGQSVSMWFDDSGNLDSVFLANDALMNQMG